MNAGSFRVGRVYLYCLVVGVSLQGCKEERKTSAPIVLPAGYEVRYYQGMRYGLFIPPTYDAKRAYDAFGRKVGSRENEEGQIFIK